MKALALLFLATTALADPACLKGDFSKTPEKDLSKLMSAVADEEVFIRLIFAETLASDCASKEVAEGIAWVIKNRIDTKNEKRFGMGRGVAFKELQFRSSAGSCDVSRRPAFICPTSIENWKETWDWAAAAYQKSQSGKNPLPKAYQYYLYRHFDRSKDCAKFRGALPSWARSAITPEGLSIDPSCVRFYK